jgi:DNA-binding XRE family transcriptional regulator
MVPKPDGTGVAAQIKVNVPVKWDEELREWLLTPKAHEIIENTKARHMGLLLAGQLKELRERCDFSQKEMGELFQVGEKSWTRWESGNHRPSRSINLMIRALYDGEISVNYLLELAGKPKREELEWAGETWQWHLLAKNPLCRASLTTVAGGHPTVTFARGEGHFFPLSRSRIFKLAAGRRTIVQQTMKNLLQARRHELSASPVPEEDTTNRIQFSKAA